MSNNKIIVKIDPEIKHFIPGYLANRENDCIKITALLGQDNFEQVRILGHRLQGSGKMYGFELLSDLGGQIETAAIKNDRAKIMRLVTELSEYLKAVECV